MKTFYHNNSRSVKKKNNRDDRVYNYIIHFERPKMMFYEEKKKFYNFLVNTILK